MSRALKTWTVRFYDGTEPRTHTVDAHYAFNNPGEGLVFRRHQGDDTEGKTTVVAAYSSFIYYGVEKEERA